MKNFVSFGKQSSITLMKIIITERLLVFMESYIVYKLEKDKYKHIGVATRQVQRDRGQHYIRISV